MKRFLTCLLVAALCVSCFATMAFAAGNATIKVSSVEVPLSSAGKTVELKVTTSAPTAAYGMATSSAYEIVDGKALAGFLAYNGKIGADDSEACAAGAVLFTIKTTVPADAKYGEKYPVTVTIDYVADGALNEYTVNSTATGYIIIEDAPATEPPATEPPATEPPATEPPATEPPATEPPATEPPATEPPATEPPATEPPATEPPATEPPATEPPATEPPATEPPATEPPATEPPATEPGVDDEPKNGDITGIVVFGTVAMISMVAAAAYVCKRKFAK